MKSYDRNKKSGTTPRREGISTKVSKKMYSLIWGQCDDPIQSRIKEVKKYTNIKKGLNAVKLLKDIKNKTG